MNNKSMTVAQREQWHIIDGIGDIPYKKECLRKDNCCYGKYSKCNPVYLCFIDVESFMLEYINDEPKLCLNVKEIRRLGSFMSDGIDGIITHDRFYLDANNYSRINNNVYFTPLFRVIKNSQNITLEITSYHKIEIQDMHIEKINTLKICKNCPYKNTDVCLTCPLKKETQQQKLSCSGNVAVATSFQLLRPAQRKIEFHTSGRKTYDNYEYKRDFIASGVWEVRKEIVPVQSESLQSKLLCGV